MGNGQFELIIDTTGASHQVARFLKFNRAAALAVHHNLDAAISKHRGGKRWRKHAIAHNKVMVIDSETILTGSFNFTKAAEQSHAENLLMIHDAKLAKQYADNWREHERHSEVSALTQRSEALVRFPS